MNNLEVLASPRKDEFIDVSIGGGEIKVIYFDQFENTSCANFGDSYVNSYCSVRISRIEELFVLQPS